MLRYVPDNAQLQLNVRILSICNQNIGFRYDYKKPKRDNDNDIKDPLKVPDVFNLAPPIAKEPPKEPETCQDLLSKSIIPTETRKKMVVEISVQETASCSIIIGPVTLIAFTDFDHNYFTTPFRVNQESLGQLTDVETAEDAVLKPLNKKMARKIVDYICECW